MSENNCSKCWDLPSLAEHCEHCGGTGIEPVLYGRVASEEYKERDREENYRLTRIAHNLANKPD